MERRSKVGTPPVSSKSLARLIAQRSSLSASRQILQKVHMATRHSAFVIPKCGLQRTQQARRSQEHNGLAWWDLQTSTRWKQISASSNTRSVTRSALRKNSLCCQPTSHQHILGTGSKPVFGTQRMLRKLRNLRLRGPSRQYSPPYLNPLVVMWAVKLHRDWEKWQNSSN